jgi:hypothetical protein
MIVAIALLLQTSGATVRTPAPPPRRVSAADSAALVQAVRLRESWFWRQWRDLWGRDQHLKMIIHHPGLELPPVESKTYLMEPTGMCIRGFEKIDADIRTLAAHVAKVPGFPEATCPLWLDQRYPEPVDQLRNPDALFFEETGSSRTREQKALMTGFLKESGDSAARLRAPVLRLLDSAARLLPGDPFIAGQRVRLHVDQMQYPQALRAAKECEADFWWCFALTGYVHYILRDNGKATDAFTQSRKLMPDSLHCAWDDVTELLAFSARQEYEKLSCIQQRTINDRIWWLADPLFVERGNERRTEHDARRVLIELMRPPDDDWWKTIHQFQLVSIVVIRWGWPSLFTGSGTPATSPRRGDMGETFLGRWGTKQWYWGPQYHLIPTWDAIMNPFSATDAAWDIAPPRERAGLWGGKQVHWDQSWWAPEFIRRDAGPLVPLLYQIAFFRRQNTAILAAGLNWDTVAYTYRPPNRVIAAALIGNTPTGQLYGVRDTMTVARPRAMAAAVPSGPGLLGLEMVPRDASGAAGRTRLGITVPPGLSALSRGTLALSDPVLLRPPPGGNVPTSADEMLPLMLGSTRLTSPTRVGVFWELYGLNRGDTIDVAVKLIRRDDGNVAQRVMTLMGVRPAGDDSLVVTWKEPRPGDVLTPVANGVSIAPRGVTLNLAAMAEGRYTLEVIVQRGIAAPVSSRREFSIDRP